MNEYRRVSTDPQHLTHGRGGALRIACGRVGQTLVRIGLPALASFAVVVAMGIAADYGIAPALAAEVLVGANPQAPGATQSESVSGAGASTVVTAIGPDPGDGKVRLPGHVAVLPAKAELLAVAQRFGRASASERARDNLTLTIVLNRDDEAGIERYLQDVYDPQSTNYRHFLTQTQLSDRFGPSRQGYTQLRKYLRAQGFTVVQDSKNRMTLTVRGTRAITERAFAVHINDFQIDGAVFYATDRDPALPMPLARRVANIGGLTSGAQVQSAYIADQQCGGKNGGSVAKQHQIDVCKAKVMSKVLSLGLCGVAAFSKYPGAPPLVPLAGYLFIPLCFAFQSLDAWVTIRTTPSSVHTRSTASAIGTTKAASAVTTGAGQTIGVLEFDAFNTSDVADFLALTGAPASQINNLSVKSINGGVSVPGSNESEVLLDIDTVMAIAPGAKVISYQAPFNGQAAVYSALFNAMINDGVTVISNSWASCEDQISQADAQGIDAVLQTAAASGISVFNGTGDSGSTCLDGSANTISVPADSPNATAVGATSLTSAPSPAFTHTNETWWDGSTDTPVTGQSGFGVSKFFSRPTYQDGINPSAMRSIPDVVILGDPATGTSLCEADNGGCTNGLLFGGTSLAAPEWAAIAALMNQLQGKNLGNLNKLLYPLAATDAFNNAASMGSDFAHVGLGSPNPNILNRRIKGAALGLPDATASQVTPLATSAVATVLPDGSVATPADGTSQAGVLVTLYDANGYSVSGKTVTLHASGGSATITPASAVTNTTNGAVVFTITDLTPEIITFTATDTTDGTTLAQTAVVTFGVPPATSAGIDVNPPTVAADGQSAATIVVTLKDVLNRPTPGKLVTISNGGTNAVVSGPVPGVTDANGQIQFSATDQVTETATFTAIDATDGNLPVPGSGTVSFTNAAANSCQFGVAPAAASGYLFTSYLSGFAAAQSLFYANTNFGCVGADNPVFTSNGKVLTVNFLNGALFQTGLTGGSVSSSNQLSTLNPAISGFVYGKDGSLYYSQSGEGGFIAQLDPVTGTQTRIVASGLTCPAGLSVDPLSGDLFFDDECSGGGTNDPTVYRIVDPANTDVSRPTTVVAYATLPNSANGGMAFAPNGTLYAVSGYYGNLNAPVVQVSGTNTSPVTVTTVPGVTSDFGIAIGQTNANGSAQTLIVEPAGTLSVVPIANPAGASVIATGGPGVGVIGPDGCMYTSRYTVVYRISTTAGTCAFTPTSPAPSLALTPAKLAANPAQGSTQSFTATLRNLPTLAGTPVLFIVTGANPQYKLVTTDAGGNAVFAYTALVAGNDTVVALTSANTTTNAPALTSNVVPVTWTAGKDTAYLTLNPSPQTGAANQPVTVSASLSDVSANPAIGSAGQRITFTLGTSTCSATTDSTGKASCVVTAGPAGTSTLAATFSGSGQLTAASAAIGFNSAAPIAPAPTVTLSGNPTTVAVGATSTLTWSSTNATACTASGAWSGTEPSSGTQTVTLSSEGVSTYTLTCTGDGGSAMATASISATLVAVTVTAKSGGGAIGWSLLVFLGMLVLSRLRSLRVVLLSAMLAVVAIGAARADSAIGGSAPAPAAAPDLSDPFYIGIRVGAMPVRQYADRIDQGLADRGFDGVTASTDNSGTAGTLFLGYEFTRHTAVELGYTYREATAAHLSGTVASTANLTPLLQNTTELLRGYGNILSLSYAGRFEVLPRLSLEPRLGGFYWATKVTASGGGDRIDTTHEGGGVTAGLTAAYRVWRGLELGLSVDHYRGSPSNIATLYAGTLEWRFGY